MAQLRYNGRRARRQSTCANVQKELVSFQVTREYPTPTKLPAAGDIIEIAEFTTNLWITSIKLFVPPQKSGAPDGTPGSWSGGAVDLGWTVDGDHPVDVHQVPTHRAPRVDETLFAEANRFTAAGAVAPTAAGAEAILYPVNMLDFQYNGNREPSRMYDWNMTLKPAAAPAEGDEIHLLMEYIITAT